MSFQVTSICIPTSNEGELLLLQNQLWVPSAVGILAHLVDVELVVISMCKSLITDDVAYLFISVYLLW